MKTANILALSSFLLTSLVAAAPVNRREMVYVTKTEEVVETVDIYTTIWVDATPTSFAVQAAPTSSSIGGLFYEQPSSAVSSQAASSALATSAAAAASPSVAPPVVPSSPVYVAPSSNTPTYVAPISSVYTPPSPTPQAPSSTQTPTPAYTPAPSSVSVAAAPATGAPASHYSGDITYYNPAGGYGACGWTIQDSDMQVALAHEMMGAQSNGNPWCGKKITILHDGQTHTATIGDKCGGCDGESIDLTAGLWAIVAPDVDGRAHNVEWWVNE